MGKCNFLRFYEIFQDFFSGFDWTGDLWSNRVFLILRKKEEFFVGEKNYFYNFFSFFFLYYFMVDILGYFYD